MKNNQTVLNINNITFIFDVWFFKKIYLFFLKKILLSNIIYMFKKTMFKKTNINNKNQWDLLIKYNIIGSLP